uniref:Ig-like domain-containing protein n=1 Tax=Myripristis murdjan TaxID=586833 RepID=A0A667ZQX5_9TELE
FLTGSPSAGLNHVSSFLLLFFAVFEAQEIRIWPEVTGYVGDDVTLTCQFIKGPADSVNIFNSTLKERVSFAGGPKYDQSLVIRDVQTADGGLYQCSVATFPCGSFDKTTQLIVRGEKPLSPGVVAGIVIAVLLLLVIVVATAYLIIIRQRCVYCVFVYMCVCVCVCVCAFVRCVFCIAMWCLKAISSSNRQHWSTGDTTGTSK